MHKFCGKCGTKLTTNCEFCVNCGAKLKEYNESEPETSKNIELEDPEPITCTFCGGKGKQVCEDCKGSGNCYMCLGSGICVWCSDVSSCDYCQDSKLCMICRGLGKCKTCDGKKQTACKHCEGTGNLIEETKKPDTSEILVNSLLNRNV
jgi:hypothetical protein